MRSYIGITWLLLSLAIIVQGCADEFNPDEQINGTMTAVIDGQNWMTDQVSGAIVNGVLNVTGVSASGETIVITLTSSTTPGFYPLELPIQDIISYQTSVGGSPFVAPTLVGNSGGTVIVTDVNATKLLMSGTFEARVYNPNNQTSHIITRGRFTNIPYVLETGNSNNKSLSVKIDGTLWEATSIAAGKHMGILAISGDNASDDKSIALFVDENIAIGTYNNLTMADAQYHIGTSKILGADNGTMTITKHTVGSLIEGTFEFNASSLTSGDTAVLTEGKFSVAY